MLPRSSVLRLALVLLVPSALACKGELPERSTPNEEEEEEDELQDIDACLEMCDPLDQDCSPGETCVPNESGFSCRGGTYSNGDGTRRGLHDACEAGSQTCGEGLVCLQVVVPGCTGGSGCCVAICDINHPECTDGTECYPVFEAAKMCYEEVGVCVLL